MRETDAFESLMVRVPGLYRYWSCNPGTPAYTSVNWNISAWVEPCTEQSWQREFLLYSTLTLTLSLLPTTQMPRQYLSPWTHAYRDPSANEQAEPCLNLPYLTISAAVEPVSVRVEYSRPETRSHMFSIGTYR